ncbi:LD-carboxypeptidase [Amnibacterium sp.]|uniref:S66 peptidase family protein n=1 Tax=Amnibacterium sp. TaxID=1872496 RepID=UPI0026158F2D|nr:S66 peptidase family protein [Amnibacterium sp.]MCU1475195.1 LD-carboxypeptidase [Amnibacterium sp.]
MTAAFAPLRPSALHVGDTVAVAALSSGLEESERAAFDDGVQELERAGFTVQVSPLVELGRHDWWSAARPAVIAAELNRLLADPEVRAIFALTGGRTTFSYLDLVDLDAVRADPKPIVGFSDINGLQLALSARTRLVTVHGDLVTHGFGYRHELPEPERARLADAYRLVLTGTHPAGALPVHEAAATWRAGQAEGPLLGGILNRIVRLQGTPFALPAERFDGAILFLEDVGASTSGLWNDLHVLRLAGLLDRINGLVFGPASTVEVTEDGPGLAEVVLDVVPGVPVLGDVNIGHEPPNLPLPVGVRAALDAGARTLALLEPAVR